MQTLEQGNDWVMWMEQFVQENTLSSVARAPTDAPGSQGDSWERTDRQFHFRATPPANVAVERGLTAQPTDDSSARARWLQEHDVRTEFLDAGIGCCWFAQQGDDEPVCGQTEDAAISRLARENGLPWNEPLTLPGALNPSKTR